jgi:predicted RNA polymerase sigma factor
LVTTLEQVFRDQWGRVLAALIGFLATRGELLRRLGRTQETREAYRRALALVHDAAERRLLQRRLAELDTAAGR